jgi:uncharacterized damage-inducible protein DinB
MMTTLTENFVELMRYNTWADQTLLNAALKLAPAEWDVVRTSPSLNTIRENLVHTMAVQEAWLLRFQGVSPTHFAGASDYPDRDAFAAKWAEVHQRIEATAATLNDATMTESITYKNIAGIEFTHAKFLVLQHIIIHSMDHRITCSAFCALAGSDPGDLNLLTYLRQQKKS